jgi:hypothetical protein
MRGLGLHQGTRALGSGGRGPGRPPRRRRRLASAARRLRALLAAARGRPASKLPAEIEPDRDALAARPEPQPDTTP